MANEVQVDIKINGLGQSASGIKDLTSALQGLQKPAQQTQDSLKSIEGALTSVSLNGFKKFASIAVASFGAIAATFAGKEVIQAALEQEKSINDLNVTLAQMGIYSKKTAQDMLEFSDAIQKTTKYSGEQVRSVMSLLGVIATLDEEGLKKATKATLDLASSSKIDAESAARSMGKAIEGNTGALKRYGINVRQGANETENLANILSALSSQSGRSEKDLLTFGGSIDFLKNGFSEVLASIGNVLVKDPLISKMIKGLGDLFFSLSDAMNRSAITITDVIIGIIDSMIKLGVTFNGVSQVISSIITGALIAGFIALTIAIEGFIVSSIAGFSAFATRTAASSAIAITGMDTLTAATVLASTTIQTSLAAATLGLSVVIVGLIAYISKLSSEFGGLGNTFKATITNISIGLLGLKIWLLEVGDTITSIVDKGAQKFIKLVNLFNAFTKLPPIEFDLATDNTDKIQKINDQITAMQVGIVKTNDELEKSKSIDPFASARDGLKKLQEDFKKTQEDFANNKNKKDNPLLDTKKIKSDFESLYKSLEGLDQGDLGRLQAVYNQRKTIIDQYLKYNQDKDGLAKKALLALETDFNKQKTELEKKQADDAEKLRKDALAKRKEEVDAAKANPLGSLLGLDKEIKNAAEFVIKPKVQGIVEGFGTALLKGKEGASNLITGLVTQGIDKLLPGVGTAIAPFIEAFSKGPEAVKQMVKDFLGAIPTLITNIISSIPAFIEALIEEAPRVIDRLVTEVPRAIESLVRQVPRLINRIIEFIPSIVKSFAENAPFIAFELAKQMPIVAFSFIEALVSNVPYLVFAMGQGIGNAIADLINSINPFSGGGGGSFLEDLSPFASGGKIVRGGVPGKDSVPIKAMEGELIVDKGLTTQIQSFFDGNSNGSNNDVTNALLGQVISLLSKDQTVETKVQLNNKTLADILINLNRTNTRLA